MSTQIRTFSDKNLRIRIYYSYAYPVPATGDFLVLSACGSFFILSCRCVQLNWAGIESGPFLAVSTNRNSRIESEENKILFEMNSDVWMLKPRLPYFSVCCMETKHMAWEAPIATEMTRKGPKPSSSSLRKFTLTGSGWTSGRPGTPSWQSLAFPHMYKSPFSAQTIKNKNISSCRLFTERKFDYLHLVNRRHDVESQ